MENIIFKKEDFTENELDLLRLAFSLLDAVIYTKKIDYVYSYNDAFSLKSKLGISDLVDL